MPSLHAADALIVGVVLAASAATGGRRSLWALWPAWVWFSVMATANHFWLDVRRRHRRRADRHGDRLPRGRRILALMLARPPVRRSRLRSRRATPSARVEAGASSRATRPARAARDAVDPGLARTRVTPNALTTSRRHALRSSPRCSSTSSTATRSSSSGSARPSSSLGSILDILDGALARAERQGHAVRRVPRLDDRPRRARASCSARSRSSSRATATRWRSRRRSPRSPAPSSSRTRAPAPRRSASRATSASARAPSASS